MSHRPSNQSPRATPAPPPPDAHTARPAAGRPRTVLCQLLVCFTVVLALSSSHLEATASAQPFGVKRSVTLAVARPFHRLAAAAGLDQPDRALARLLGRDDDGPPEAAAPATGRVGRGGTPAAASPLPPATDPGPIDTGPGPDPGDAADTTPPRFGPPRPGPTADPTLEPGGAVADPGAAPDRAGPGAALASALGVVPMALPADPLLAGPAPGLGPDLVEPMTVAVAPLTEPAPARAVDSSAKLRLWAGGDSLGEYVGNQLLAPLSDRDRTTVDLDFHIGTGLTRPDTYDWAARINEVMARPEPPEALMFMVGGNDNQPMRAGGQNLAVGSEPWLTEYRARVVAIMDTTRTGASHLWWIGLPPMRDQERDGLARAIDAIVAEEAANRPWVTFVDLMPRFSGPDGGFAGTLPGPDGQPTVVRAPDGIHITYAGSTWVADGIWADIVGLWGLT